MYLIDHEGDSLNLQYCFDDAEHSVIPCPHANSHRVVRTMPITLQKLWQASTNLTAKFAVCKSTDDLFIASSASTLSRNTQQVANMRRCRDEKETSSFSKKKDPLFLVMLMCKGSEGGKPKIPLFG